MSEPVPPPVPLPGGVVLGPDGSVSFPGQAQQGQAGGPAPIVPGVQEAAPSPTPPPVVGSGQFTVDLERAPMAIRELEDALARLEQLRDEARLMGKVDAPGRDSVSIEAAAALSFTAVGGPGSFVEALNAGAEELRTLIAISKRELSNYRGTEGSATSSLDSTRA